VESEVAEAQHGTAVPPGTALRRGLLFGLSVTPNAEAYRAIVGQVLAAERGGLDLVGIQDHPYQRRFLDTFSLMADVLARTERIHVFPDVANLPLRTPPMLAKAAASLDVMSSGRFELGIGSGAFWQAVTGMGGPNRSTAEAVGGLEEAIGIIRAALDGERVVRGPGPVYPVPGYPPGPPPAHRVEIWVGAYRPRGLRLIGRLADGWVPSLAYMGPDGFRTAAAVLDTAAEKAGRDPRTIRRIYNVAGSITDGDRGPGVLDGPVAHWVDTLASWATDLGVTAFIFWPPDTDVRHVERFAAEVAPAVRRAVEGEGTGR
jgi:alkanesulfonate monooxygenase SsuD/methylene tetrahydromethanopterin reductase-like flavin-dependent oxidoreductase (luciferase family)